MSGLESSILVVLLRVTYKISFEYPDTGYKTKNQMEDPECGYLPSYKS